MAPRGRRPPTHVDSAAALGQRVASARRAAGLSLRALAWDGCSPAFISRIESGTRVPSVAVLQELGRRLGVPYEQLAGRPLAAEVREADLVDAELLVRLGAEGAEEAATRLLARAQELGDSRGQSRMAEALGQLCIDARDDDGAIGYLEDALRLAGRPSARLRPALYESLGRAYAGSGDVSRAISILRPAFEEAAEAPEDPILMVRFGVFLASSLTDIGQPGEALNILSRIVGREDDVADPVARARLEWALSRTYAEAGRSEIAERYARRVVSFYETSEEMTRLGRANLVLGAILLDEGRVDEANESLARADSHMVIAAAPERALLSYEQGRAALAGGDLDLCAARARQAIDETERTEPGTAGMAYVLLAKVHLAREEYEEAEFVVRQAIDLLEGTTAAPYRADAFEALADAQVGLDDQASAIASLRTASQLRKQATLGLTPTT